MADKEMSWISPLHKEIMRQSHLILSNAAIMWITRVFLLVPQLILVPYLIGTIGESGYGVYALVWSLMMSIEQLQRALQQGVVKYSASFLAQGRMEEVNAVVSSSFVYSIILAVLGSAGTRIAAAFYRDSSGQIGSALVVVGIVVVCIVPLTPYIAVIQSRQRYYVGAIAGTLSKYLSLLVVMFWFHMVGPSVEALIVIMATMLFLARLAQVPIAYRLVPGLQIRTRLCNWRHFRLIVSFGGMVVLIGLCLMANSTGIRWMMGMLVSTSFVTHLAIMLMPGTLLVQIILAATITVMPATSAYEAIGNQRMLQELLVRGMRYTTILGLGSLLAASLLMRSVLSVWVGADYVFLTPYAIVLFASRAFMMSTSVGHHMLRGLGKLRVTVLIYSLGYVIVPVGLILCALQIWRVPYVIVTAALVAGHLVAGCLNIVFATKAVHVKLRRVLMRIYIQPLLIATMVCLIALATIMTNDFDRLVARICLSIGTALVFFGGSYVIIATPKERDELKAGIRLATSKLAPGKSST